MNIYVPDTYVFDTTNWVTLTTTGPTITQDCGSLAVSYSMTPNENYLTVSPSTTATIDFLGTTSTAGNWVLTVEVQAAAYTGDSDPVDTYSYTITATDPCDSADALSFDDAFIASTLAGNYDLFDGPDSYTFDPTDIVAPNVDYADSAYVDETNCGALVVTLAYSSGPSGVFI